MIPIYELYKKGAGMSSRLVNVLVPDELIGEIDEVAAAEGRTRSELLREAARRYIAERKPNRKNASLLLSRLAALAVRGPNVSAQQLDAILYGKRRPRSLRSAKR